MKKDFLNYSAKLGSMLFLFFLCFAMSNLSAQVALPGSSTMDANNQVGTIYLGAQMLDVDQIIDQANFIDAPTAKGLFEAEAKIAYGNSNSDNDELHVRELLKTEFYKTLARFVADGNDVSTALKLGALELTALSTKHYGGHANSQPNLVQILSGAIGVVSI